MRKKLKGWQFGGLIMTYRTHEDFSMCGERRKNKKRLNWNTELKAII